MWQNVLDFLTANWAELLLGLLAFVKIVVRLTPTLKDDQVFGLLDKLLESFVPNLKK
jgi:hypothetical protein